MIYQITLHHPTNRHIKLETQTEAKTEFRAVWKTLQEHNTKDVKWIVYEIKRTRRTGKSSL